MKIGDHEIGPGHKTFVIAECGTGHAGETRDDRVRLAMHLAEASIRAGADAVKFQLFVHGENLFCPMEGDERRWARWIRTMLDEKDWAWIKDNVEDRPGSPTSPTPVFLASAFQYGAVKMLTRLGVKAYKVGARAADTFPWVEDAPHIVSINFMLSRTIRTRIYVALACRGKYPTPLNEARWNMAEGFTWPEGLSDHSGTPWPAIDAIMRGAYVVEVHVKLDDEGAGPDASSAVTFDQLKLICEARDAAWQMRSG